MAFECGETGAETARTSGSVVEVFRPDTLFAFQTFLCQERRR
jgi:hypothetical protein